MEEAVKKDTRSLKYPGPSCHLGRDDVWNLPVEC